MFRQSDAAAIKPGQSYRLSRGHWVVATATVLVVEDDGLGVAHVRFLLELATPSGPARHCELRALSLESFAELYADRVVRRAVHAAAA